MIPQRSSCRRKYIFSLTIEGFTQYLIIAQGNRHRGSPPSSIRDQRTRPSPINADDVAAISGSSNGQTQLEGKAVCMQHHDIERKRTSFVVLEVNCSCIKAVLYPLKD